MIYAFGKFELDTRLYELRRAGTPVSIEPQVFDLLCLLVECRDRVVEKTQILQRVWADRFISESTLASRVTAVRKAIDDSAKDQLLIKTVHGRGYRFVADVEERADVSQAPVAPPADETSGPLAGGSDRTVGRRAELDRLQERLRSALAGIRQLVFVTGEAGLGKTTLVESFLQRARSTGTLWAGTGQCLEHSGPGEAYMPVLEALGQLCRQPGGREIVQLLVRRAPTWMAQMPWLLSDEQLKALQGRVEGARKERMLREMGEAMEALSADRPLLFVLEDLHWSDPSTVDLIAWVGARSEPCRLMLIGTYRPEKVAASGHALAAVHQRLRLRSQCADLALPFLDEEAVRQYLASRVPDGSLPERLAPMVLQRTDGNPLFVGNLVDAWIAEGFLVEADGHWSLRGAIDDLAGGVPETLRQLIERRLAELDPEARCALECASVVGMTFSSAVVAAALERPEAEVETRLTRLAEEGRFLRASGTSEWPDGTIAARFEFIHSLYRDVIYNRVPAGRKATHHRQVGSRLERAYGDRARESAAALALHFTRARDARRAVSYLDQAARCALERSAHLEATTHFRNALELLGELPDGEERARTELQILITYAPALAAIRGWADEEVERAFRRAHEVCDRLQDEAQMFPVLYGLAEMYELRGEFEACQATMDQANTDQDWPRLEFHEILACSVFHEGKFDRALDHADRARKAFDPESPDPYLATYGESAIVRSYVWTALALWFKGFPDQAEERLREGLELAEGSALTYSLSGARSYLACLYHLRREPEPTLKWARETMAVAARHGFAYREAIGRILEGWVLATGGETERGIEQIRNGLDVNRQVGVQLDRPYFQAILAEAYGAAARIEEGLDAVREGLEFIESTRSYFYEPELHRLEGVLRLEAGPHHDAKRAEACFQRALDVARRLGARSLELRAAVSLGRLWQEQERFDEAVSLISAVSGGFREGLDTPDLVEARELLEE